MAESRHEAIEAVRMVAETVRAAGGRALFGEWAKPLVMGRDLIALGMKPGVEFGKILKAAYEAQFDGTFATHEDGVGFVRKMKGTAK